MLKIILKLFKEFFRILLGRRRIRQSYNLFKYRNSRKTELLEYKPIYLTILPIHRCNLACKMCLTHSKEILDNEFRHKYFKDMTFEMFQDIVAHFSEALAVGFMGNGELLLHEDIFRMIDWAESHGKMHTAMITNGVILDKFVDEILSSSLSEICISINGHNEKEYSRMTAMPKEYFGRIVYASSDLINKRNESGSQLKITASIVVDKTNIEYLQEMVDFVDSLKFDALSLYNILPLTLERAGRMAIFDSQCTKKILDGIRLPKSGMTVTLPVPLDGKAKNNICNDFFTSINIDGAGNVGGCNRQRFNIELTGKYFDTGVWNNDYFRNERRKFLDQTAELDEPCQVCYANSSFITLQTRSAGDE